MKNSFHKLKEAFRDNEGAISVDIKTVSKDKLLLLEVWHNESHILHDSVIRKSLAIMNDEYNYYASWDSIKETIVLTFYKLV